MGLSQTWYFSPSSIIMSEDFWCWYTGSFICPEHENEVIPLLSPGVVIFESSADRDIFFSVLAFLLDRVRLKIAVDVSLSMNCQCRWFFVSLRR